MHTFAAFVLLVNIYIRNILFDIYLFLVSFWFIVYQCIFYFNANYF